MTSAATAIPPYVLAAETSGESADLELVKRAKAGQVDAFSQLVRRHQRVVYNLAYRFMRDASLAEDMVQEAFLKAYRLLRGFRGDCGFSTWMYRVTCSVCLSELSRRKKRNEVAFSPAYEHLAGETDIQPTDIYEIIRRCVTKLPDRYATVVTLYYLNELSYDEIAEVMSIPVGTLKTWMHRARKQLREIVEKELSGDETGLFS
jgi:RNA polymerase sigma-70 factor, ECF subfamily